MIKDSNFLAKNMIINLKLDAAEYYDNYYPNNGHLIGETMKSNITVGNVYEVGFVYGY